MHALIKDRSWPVAGSGLKLWTEPCSLQFLLIQGVAVQWGDVNTAAVPFPHHDQTIYTFLFDYLQSFSSVVVPKIKFIMIIYNVTKCINFVNNNKCKLLLNMKPY